VKSSDAAFGVDLLSDLANLTKDQPAYSALDYWGHAFRAPVAIAVSKEPPAAARYGAAFLTVFA
jgi:hypothetical protein